MFYLKDSNYSYLFYITATICFLFVIGSIVTDSPAITTPAEYVYWEDESSDLQESSQESFVESSSQIESVTKEHTTKPTGNPPSKHYVSSNPQVSSQAVSSNPVSSEILSSNEEESSPPPKEESQKEEKPKPDISSIVNINIASKEQLMSLEGIGDVISQRIIITRKEIGGFNSIEELMIVKGIGEKIFANIKHRLTV